MLKREKRTTPHKGIHKVDIEIWPHLVIKRSKTKNEQNYYFLLMLLLLHTYNNSRL